MLQQQLKRHLVSSSQHGGLPGGKALMASRRSVGDRQPLKNPSVGRALLVSRYDQGVPSEAGPDSDSSAHNATMASVAQVYSQHPPLTYHTEHHPRPNMVSRGGSEAALGSRDFRLKLNQTSTDDSSGRSTAGGPTDESGDGAVKRHLRDLLARGNTEAARSAAAFKPGKPVMSFNKHSFQQQEVIYNVTKETHPPKRYHRAGLRAAYGKFNSQK